MTNKKMRNKNMKKLKEYIVKDFMLIKEGEDKDGYIAYLFIKDGNFYHVYDEKDGVFIQHLGPVRTNKLKEEING